jgi:hypothetical protein
VTSTLEQWLADIKDLSLAAHIRLLLCRYRHKFGMEPEYVGINVDIYRAAIRSGESLNFGPHVTVCAFYPTIDQMNNMPDSCMVRVGSYRLPHKVSL